MKIFGLTGGIGSGKSTISRYWFEHRNLPIIDADKIARNIVEPKTKCLSEIIKKFSETILLANGSLDRKKLGKIVFGNAKKLKILNEIMAPYLEQEIQREIDRVAEEDYRIACFDAALITDKYKPLVVVKTTREIQIERVMKRNNLTEEEVIQRIDAQIDYENEPTYIINNDGDLKDLYKQADKVLDQIFESM